MRCRIGYLVLLSKLIAVLSCLSQRGSSQGIDEPADLECRGVPAFVASCWAQESPKLSITRSADWRETLGSRTAWHHCYLLGSRAVASAPFSSSISRAVVVVLLKSSLVCSCASWLEWSYAGWGVLRLCPYFRAISTHLFFNGDTSRDIKTNIHRPIHTDILKTPVLAKVHWLFICISYVRFFPWPGIRKESGALFTHRKAQKRLRNWLCIEAVCSSFFYLKLSFTEITGLCGHGGRDVSPEGALGLLLGLYTIQEKLLGALMKFWMTK